MLNAHTIKHRPMVGLHHHPDLLPLQGQLTAATSRQNRPSTRRALSLDSGASACSECYYAYYLGDVHRSAFIEGDLERNFGSKCLPGLLHHRFMFFHVSNYTNQSASLESASCLRRKRDYVVAPHPQADRPTCRATSAGGQTNLSLPDMHQAQPKEGH